MGTVLDKLAENARLRVAADKKIMPEAELKRLALSRPKGEKPFLSALKKPGLSFICEVKKASPSKGVISEDFPYMDIAADYERAGADCISCLTEPKWFLGSDEIFRDIRRQTSLPMLRKDFTVDAYQIYQAKLMGADAVLIICAITEGEKIKEYLSICEELGLSALTETHDRGEIELALSCGAEIIGVNNRNLKDFSVDAQNCSNLRGFVPPECLLVSESGIRTRGDILRLGDADGVLIGETLMRSADRAKTLRELRGEA